jgi:hypothetical protein
LVVIAVAQDEAVLISVGGVLNDKITSTEDGCGNGDECGSGFGRSNLIED